MGLTRMVLILLWLLFLTVVAVAEEDLYKILGVSKTASTKEIKSAYRKKALDTHPDKNQDKPPEQAAQDFHKVVHAYETLTDANSRRNYDRTGRSGQQQQNQGGDNGGQRRYHSSFQWTWNSHGYRTQRLKDKFQVKEAQSRVMHIVSMEQLKTIMLDDDDKLERNLLMVFCTPMKVEEIVDDEIVFPYPFAAKSSQGIWWEDMLQTVKIRYHKENDMTKFFKIPHGDEMRASGQPIFLFGKRGQRLDDDFVRLQTIHRQMFDSWVWKRIEVEIVFVNEHDHPVEIFWIHDRSATLITKSLLPGVREHHTTMLSHEWWVRDARVDTRKDSPRRTKLTKESMLGIWKIVSDENGQEIIIRKKTCFDLSGHCDFWNHHGECTKNPVFMKEQCIKTCKLCSDDNDQPPTTASKKSDKEEL